jgi:hypothetical protein
VQSGVSPVPRGNGALGAGAGAGAAAAARARQRVRAMGSTEERLVEGSLGQGRDEGLRLTGRLCPRPQTAWL